MPDTKNFRSNYYEKIGFKAVDIKKSLESILSEPTLDKPKLGQFVIKYELPAQYRVVVWKYLLNVSSSNKEAADFVWDQRREQFQILLKSLITMRRLPAAVMNDEEGDRREMMSSMVALEENRLPWAESSDTTSVPSNIVSPRRHLQQRKGWEEDFDIVFDVVQDSLTVEDEVETYWLCRNMYKVIMQRKLLLQAQMKETESYIWRKDSSLAAHLESGNVFKWPAVSSVVIDLLRYAFAGVFRYEAVISLWDKIVSGSAMGEVFVLAEVLLTHRTLLMATPANLLLEKLDRVTREISIVNQHTIIDRALEVWQLEFGGILHPNLAAPVAGPLSAVASSSSTSAAPATFPSAQAVSNDVRQKMSVDVTNARTVKPRKFSNLIKM